MKKAVILAASMLTLLAGGCERPAEVRYRMTVEVDTPEGVRSGSSVWSWTLSKPTAALATPYDGRFRGEAVAVDLPSGRTLFALVSGQEMVPESQFADLTPTGGRGDRVANVRAIAAQTGSVRTLRCPETWTGGENREDEIRTDCPTLAVFRDIADPGSIERVDPANLAERFGSGYSLRHIVVEITDEPVTTGMEKRLPWLKEYYETMLDGKRINDFSSFANNISVADFSTEIDP